MTERLADLLAAGGYHSYAYAYPHKTAYRTLSPAVPLREAWAQEDRAALFLYVHVPFCEQRCGFCNLFTQARPKDGVTERYIAALARQAAVVAEALASAAPREEASRGEASRGSGPARFARLAVGGGTPTFLGAPLLDRLFEIVGGIGGLGVPSSVEVSPATLDDEQLAVLAARNVTRVSVGVQSILPAETAAVSRPQARADVERVMAGLADRVPVRNVDLIYGLPGQTTETLRASVDAALGMGANEVYLYPLYTRPLTALGRARADGPSSTGPDDRLALYRVGRDHLLAAGWEQVSMRMFRAPDAPDAGAPGGAGPVYRCQDDGMVGLGAGARSYTRALHYASPFAVSQAAVRARIEDWIAQPDADFGVARHGYRLNGAEQRRRYLLLSLLDGAVDRAAYRARFERDVLADFPELDEAVACGLVAVTLAAVRLTDLGRERADVLGHWLQSPAVRAARDAWEAA